MNLHTVNYKEMATDMLVIIRGILSRVLSRVLHVSRVLSIRGILSRVFIRYIK